MLPLYLRRSGAAGSLLDGGPFAAFSQDLTVALDGSGAAAAPAEAKPSPGLASLGDVLRELDGPAASRHDLTRARR